MGFTSTRMGIYVSHTCYNIAPADRVLPQQTPVRMTFTHMVCLLTDSTTGVGDGVAVYNPHGTLLGKIFTGPPGSANFIWADDGR